MKKKYKFVMCRISELDVMMMLNFFGYIIAHHISVHKKWKLTNILLEYLFS